MNYSLSEPYLRGILSGNSIIDMPTLDLTTKDQADSFIRTYGYDLNHNEDLEEIWGIHRKAVSLLREHLLEDGEKIPDELADPTLLVDISNLLLIASNPQSGENRSWACAILKVMHAFCHIQNDLFSQYSDQIQEQVLKNFKNHINEDPAVGVSLGQGEGRIGLYKYEVKPFKRSSSSVIKLLSKRQAVAISLLDRLGVRFVTKNIFDCFKVLEYLLKENVISLPNIMPEQSNNSLYPINLFLETLPLLKGEDMDSQKAQEILNEKLQYSFSTPEYLIKENKFSSDDFKFIKFVCRHLVELEMGGKTVHFFFPYEIQLVDYESYIKNLSGAQAHEEYKKRQKQAARLRVFGSKQAAKQD